MCAGRASALDKHTLERQGRARGSPDSAPPPPPFSRRKESMYVSVPSRFFSHPLAFSLVEESGERDRRTEGERETRQMSISTMHRWEGGNEGVINRRSQGISSLFLFLVRSISASFACSGRAYASSASFDETCGCALVIKSRPWSLALILTHRRVFSNASVNATHSVNRAL